MRMSNEQAKQSALALAEAHLAAQPQKPGWHYRCVDARPDELAANPKDRKTWVAWAVVVECLFNDRLVDGPVVLLVNLATNEVSSHEPAQS